MRYDVILTATKNKNVFGAVIFNIITKGGGNTGGTYDINNTPSKQEQVSGGSPVEIM